MKKLVELLNVDSDLVAIQTLDTEEIFELVVKLQNFAHFKICLFLQICLFILSFILNIDFINKG